MAEAIPGQSVAIDDSKANRHRETLPGLCGRCVSRDPVLDRPVWARLLPGMSLARQQTVNVLLLCPVCSTFLLLSFCYVSCGASHHLLARTASSAPLSM